MADTSKHFPDGGDQVLTAREAYGALIAYLDAFWERDGRPDDGLLKLLDWTSLAGDGKPADPAMWGDWLEAIERSRRPGEPKGGA